LIDGDVRAAPTTFLESIVIRQFQEAPITSGFLLFLKT
jgi:hypothetical protein